MAILVRIRQDLLLFQKKQFSEHSQVSFLTLVGVHIHIPEQYINITCEMITMAEDALNPTAIHTGYYIIFRKFKTGFETSRKCVNNITFFKNSVTLIRSELLNFTFPIHNHNSMNKDDFFKNLSAEQKQAILKFPAYQSMLETSDWKLYEADNSTINKFIYTHSFTFSQSKN